MWQAKCIFSNSEKIKNLYKKGENVLIHELNGPIMPSSESIIVKNDVFLSKLENELIILSKKYGLGEVLFMEKNPLNRDSVQSFYIRAPTEWSSEKMFDVWGQIADETHAFAKKEGIDLLSEICHVAVSKRY